MDSVNDTSFPYCYASNSKQNLSPLRVFSKKGRATMIQSKVAGCEHVVCSLP